MLNVDGRYTLVYAHVINSTFTDILFVDLNRKFVKMQERKKKKVALLLLVIQISILYKTIECEIWGIH